MDGTRNREMSGLGGKFTVGEDLWRSDYLPTVREEPNLKL